LVPQFSFISQASIQRLN